MLFDVRTLHHDGWVVVAVVGDVDLATIPSLSSKLTQSSGTQVALDLSGVDLFEPLGFGLLIAAALRAGRDGSRFVVICPPGRPRELIAETRLDEIIEVVDRFEVLVG